MISFWLFLGILGMLSLFALGFLLYPLRQSSRTLVLFAPLLVISLAMGYWHWGNGFQWREFLIKKEQQEKIEAVLQSIKNPQELIAKMKAQVMRHPNNFKGWYLLGRLYLSQDNYPEALDSFGKAQLLNPADEATRVNYAQTLWQINKQKCDPKIRNLFEEIVQKNPEQPDALAMLAMDSYQNGDFKRAIHYWQKLLTIAPSQSSEAQMIRRAIAKAQQQLP